MFCLIVACVFFANFLALFGFLVAVPVGEWSLKNHENSLVFVGESVCAPFCAPLQKRKTLPKSNESRTPKTKKNELTLKTKKEKTRNGENGTKKKDNPILCTN